MAATDIVGYGGGFTGPNGVNADWAAWSLTLVNKVANYATFASRWEKSKLTTSKFTGSVSGTVQYLASNTQPVPLSTVSDTVGTNLTAMAGAATFTATTGCTITGNVCMTNIVLDRRVDGQMTMVANVESDGECLINWTTATS